MTSRIDALQARAGNRVAVTLAIDGFADVPPMPGTALVAAGLMLLLGVAELLDPAIRRLVIGVRFGGSAMTLLGFALRSNVSSLLVTRLIDLSFVADHSS